MDAINSTIEQLFSSRLDKFQQEMAVTQATSSQQFLDKLSRKTYTFKKKGYDEQFLFNNRVDKQINAAKSHLERVTTSDKAFMLILQQATAELEQGKEAIILDTPELLTDLTGK